MKYRRSYWLFRLALMLCITIWGRNAFAQNELFGSTRPAVGVSVGASTSAESSGALVRIFGSAGPISVGVGYSPLTFPAGDYRNYPVDVSSTDVSPFLRVTFRNWERGTRMVDESQPNAVFFSAELSSHFRTTADPDNEHLVTVSLVPEASAWFSLRGRWEIRPFIGVGYQFNHAVRTIQGISGPIDVTRDTHGIASSIGFDIIRTIHDAADKQTSAIAFGFARRTNLGIESALFDIRYAIALN
jgi:hypothetical protein